MSDDFRLNLPEGETLGEAVSRILAWHQKISHHILEGNRLPLSTDDMLTDLFNSVYVLTKIIEQATKSVYVLDKIVEQKTTTEGE